MARNPELLRAIMANPQEDTVRLAYADWLQENGDEPHAELIRVQCELARKPKLARRKVLVAREAELLADPAFHLPGHQFGYMRGFVADVCSVNLTAGGVGFAATEDDWGAEPNPFALILTATHLPVLDRFVHLRLDLASLASQGPKWDAPLSVQVLRRVSILECRHGGVEPGVFAALEKCKHFEYSTALEFVDAIEVPLDHIEKLILCAALPHLNHIRLDGESWLTAKGAEMGDDDLAAFVVRIGAHEKAVQFRSFQLNWPIGPRTADALVSAANLKLLRLVLPDTKSLPKHAKAALKKRFGKALLV